MTKYEEALKVMKQQREEAGQAFLGVVQFNAPQYYAVIEALEKQIPKKPKITKSHVKNSKFGICECGEYIFDHEKYCSKCGQALDWREGNDT